MVVGAVVSGPSPGGQEDAITLAAEAIDDLHEEMTGARVGDEVSRQFAEVALRAARQPVGRASPELYAAARDFYNETVADPSVRISCVSPVQRAVVTAAGERLRAALVTHPTQADGLGQFRALLEELINRSGDSLTADQFLLAGRLLNLIDRTK